MSEYIATNLLSSSALPTLKLPSLPPLLAQPHRHLHDTIIHMKLTLAPNASLFTGLSTAQAKMSYYGTYNFRDSSCDIALPIIKLCEKVSILQYRI